MAEEVKLSILALKQEIRCTICLGTLRNPITTKCCHNFCSECMEGLLRTRSSFPCPNCNTVLTKRNINPNEKLSRIVAAVGEVVHSYNSDLAKNGTVVKDKLYLSQSQSFYSSQRRIIPKEEIRIIVDKRFDKDDSKVDERLDDELKDVQTIQRKSPNFNDEGEAEDPQSTNRRSSSNFTATVSKTVVWDNLQNREATHSEGDPYDFVPSQVTTAIKSKKKIRKVKETKLKIDSKHVKKPKTNEQIVKQNQFYEDILGSLIDVPPILKSAEVLKPKLTVRLKFPKKSPFASLRPRPPSISPEIIHHNEKIELQLPKGEWKRPKRKADLFSDWSSSQVKKMDDLNKEFLNIDNVELNMVKEENNVNQRTEDLSADNNYVASAKRRNVDHCSLEENVSQPEPLMVRYQNESPVATMQEFTIASFNPGPDPVPEVNNPGLPDNLRCIRLSSSGCPSGAVKSSILPDKKSIRVSSYDNQLEADDGSKLYLKGDTCHRIVEEINSQHETSIEFSQKEASFGTMQEFNPIAHDFSPIISQTMVDKECIQVSSTDSPNKMKNENINPEDERNSCLTNPLLDGVFCSQPILDEEYVHILAPDTDAAIEDGKLAANTNAFISNTEIVDDLSTASTKNNETNCSMATAWRCLIYDNPDLMKPLLDNIQCTQEVDDFAEALKIKIRQERSRHIGDLDESVQKKLNFNEQAIDYEKSNIDVESNSTKGIATNINSANNLNLLASLLNGGQWKRIEPSAPAATAKTVHNEHSVQSCEQPEGTVVQDIQLSNEIQQNFTNIVEKDFADENSIIETTQPLKPTSADEVPNECLESFDETEQNSMRVIDQPPTIIKILTETISSSVQRLSPMTQSSPSDDIPNGFFQGFDEIREESTEINEQGQKENLPETVERLSPKVEKEQNAVPQEENLADEFPDEFFQSSSEEMKQNLIETVEKPIPNKPTENNQLTENIPFGLHSKRQLSNEEIPEEIFENSNENEQNSIEILSNSFPVQVKNYPSRTSTQYPEQILDELFLEEDGNENRNLDTVIISPISRVSTERRCVIEQTPSPDQERSQNFTRDLKQTSAANILDADISIELTQQKQFILCFSGFSSSENNRLNDFCLHFGCEYRRKFDSSVTHLVAKTKNVHNSELCERTMKYFQSMAARIWIISSIWMDRSVDADELLPVDSFIVNGDTVDGPHNGPEKARTANLSSRLFQGIYFFCIEPIENFIEIGQLEDMLKKCGAEVCFSLESLSQKCATSHPAYIIAQDGEHSSEFYDNLYRKFRVPILDVEFILVSLSRYSIASCINDFLLCSKKLLEEDFEVQTFE